MESLLSSFNEETYAFLSKFLENLNSDEFSFEMESGLDESSDSSKIVLLSSIIQRIELILSHILNKDSIDSLITKIDVKNKSECVDFLPEAKEMCKELDQITKEMKEFHETSNQLVENMTESWIAKEKLRIAHIFLSKLLSIPASDPQQDKRKQLSDFMKSKLNFERRPNEDFLNLEKK